jgi:sec-independent protein translocase protein TatC
MSTTELAIAAGVFAGLVLLPLMVLLVVRWRVPLTEPALDQLEAEGDGDSDGGINSLRELWEAAVPHLTELRDRLTKAVIGLVLGTAVGAFLVYGTPLGRPLPEIIVRQFVPDNVRLIAIGTAEQFVSFMGIALVVGIALAFPYLVYQIVAFIAPGLRPNEKRAVYVAIPIITELFLAGLAFAWFFTIPAAIGFLLNFGATETIENRPSLADFLSTVTTLMVWNGIVFELPAIIYLLARIGWVNTTMLRETRRYAVVIITVVAALITPTGDPYNLLLLAVPMYLLYELGIILTRFVPKRTDDGTP